MHIDKLKDRAIQIVTRNSDAFGDRLDKEVRNISDKARKCQSIISGLKFPRKQPLVSNLRYTLAELMSVILEEEIVLDVEKIYIPCHTISVITVSGRDPYLMMGSIYMQKDDEDEGRMFYRIDHKGETKLSHAYDSKKLSSPTLEQMKEFIHGLPEEVIRREFHYLED